MQTAEERRFYTFAVELLGLRVQLQRPRVSPAPRARLPHSRGVALISRDIAVNQPFISRYSAARMRALMRHGFRGAAQLPAVVGFVLPWAEALRR